MPPVTSPETGLLKVRGKGKGKRQSAKGKRMKGKGPDSYRRSAVASLCLLHFCPLRFAFCFFEKLSGNCCGKEMQKQ